jgi:hypothetical protein
MSKKSLWGSLCLVACLSMVARAADDSSTKSSDSKKSAAKSAVPADTSAKSDSAKSDVAPADEKLKGRLPNNYSKVGVSDAQKQKIYSLEASYKSQIETLQKQLSDLEAKRDADIRNVLTDDQKKKLDELTGDASKTKAAKKAAAADAKADTKTDANAPADAKTAAASK